MDKRLYDDAHDLLGAIRQSIADAEWLTRVKRSYMCPDFHRAQSIREKLSRIDEQIDEIQLALHKLEAAAAATSQEPAVA